MIRAALRDLLKKKRGTIWKLFPLQEFAIRYGNIVFMIPLMLFLLLWNRLSGSRQQDLREKGLSGGGTTGGAVSIGRAAMNQQPPTKSVFIKMCSDMLWYFNVLFKLRAVIWLSAFVRATRSAFTISSRVSQFYGPFCLFGFIYDTNRKENEKVKHLFHFWKTGIVWFFLQGKAGLFVKHISTTRQGEVLCIKHRKHQDTLHTALFYKDALITLHIKTTKALKTIHQQGMWGLYRWCILKAKTHNSHCIV